jgi:hypothetical protein
LEEKDLHVLIGKKGHGHSGVFIAVIFGREKKKKFIPRKKFQISPLVWIVREKNKMLGS